jgi:hypothetical protein
VVVEGGAATGSDGDGRVVSVLVVVVVPVLVARAAAVVLGGGVTPKIPSLKKMLETIKIFIF